MKLRNAKLQVFEKYFFTYLPSCILPSFSKKASQLLPPKRLWKCASKISFRKYKQKVVLLVIYLFNYDSSTLIHHIHPCVHFLSNKLEFIATQRLLNRSFLVLICTFFDKKLIILRHGDNTFLFWHLYQTHTFSNNLNDREMITSHLMFTTFLW